jgi:hypothetical protein
MLICNWASNAIRRLRANLKFARSVFPRFFSFLVFPGNNMEFTIKIKAFESTVTRLGTFTSGQALIDFRGSNKIEFVIPNCPDQGKLIVTGRLSLSGGSFCFHTGISINDTLLEFLELQVQNTSPTITVRSLSEFITIESSIFNILPGNIFFGHQLFDGRFRIISTSLPSPLGNSVQWKTAIKTTAIPNHSLSNLNSVPYPDFSQFALQDSSLSDFTDPRMQGVLDLVELRPNNQLLF